MITDKGKILLFNIIYKPVSSAVLQPVYFVSADEVVEREVVSDYLSVVQTAK